MDRSLASGFEGTGGFSPRIIHSGKPANGFADLLIVEIGAVNQFRLPGLILFAQSDEVGPGCAEGDGGPFADAWDDTDGLVEFDGGHEQVADVGRFGGEASAAELQRTDGVALAMFEVPLASVSFSDDQLGALSAGIDDGDSVVLAEGWVFGDGEKAELGFVFGGEDADGRALGVAPWCRRPLRGLPTVQRSRNAFGQFPKCGQWRPR